MAKTPTHVSPELLDRYEKIVSRIDGLQRKGAANPYTSVKGRMFSFFTKQGQFALRLPADAHAAFLRKHKTPPVISYGAVMKEYVMVPEAVFFNNRQINKLFATSHAYFDSLEAKATKRKATKRKAKR